MVQDNGAVKRWLEVVERKGTILCAGVDPSEYVMGRTEKGEGLMVCADKREWALKYIEAVAPHVAAIKPNVRYWGGYDDSGKVLAEMTGLAHSLGIIAIQDSKEADIGSTNDAGIFYAATRGFDFITAAPFAGNVSEAAKQGVDRRISLIGMCLMSNPEYEREKNMWVDVSDDGDNYDSKDLLEIGGIPHTKRYKQLARDANRLGLAGIVVGAPSSKNHIKPEEVERVKRYFGGEGIVLVPGIGAQGGEASILAKYFNFNNLIANVGRALMFPNGASSTPKQQAEAAKAYNEMLSKLRTS